MIKYVNRGCSLASNRSIFDKLFGTIKASAKADCWSAFIGKSQSQIQRAIAKGKAPKQIERLDKTVLNASGEVLDAAQIHFKNCGNCALKQNGTWKHSPPDGFILTKSTKDWLDAIGWINP
jgi:hypothetical protein